MKTDFDASELVILSNFTDNVQEVIKINGGYYEPVKMKKVKGSDFEAYKEVISVKKMKEILYDELPGDMLRAL